MVAFDFEMRVERRHGPIHYHEIEVGASFGAMKPIPIDVYSSCGAGRLWPPPTLWPQPCSS